MPTPSPEQAPLPLDHGTFDAGLLNAGLAAHRDLYRRHTLQKIDDPIHPEHVCTWAIPWYMEIRIETTFTIADYRRHAAERLRETCMKHGIFNRYDAAQQDTRRLMDHWAHALVKQSLHLHAGQWQDDKTHYTPDYALRRIRHSLRQVVGDKAMIIAESPVHPLWKRGAELESAMGNPMWGEKPTRRQQEIARTLLKPTQNISETAECTATDMAREAVPMLLDVDRRYFTELLVQERRALRTLLKGKECFEESDTGKNGNNLRRTAIERLLDMIAATERISFEEIHGLQTDDGPSPMDGETNEVMNAYIMPLLGDPKANKSLLEQRFPIIIDRLTRAIEEDDNEQFQALFKILTDVHGVVDIDPAVFNLIALTMGTFDKHSTPRAVRFRM